ncbi:hypothetical protein Glove_27g70 [Diversispora epigaea]|uniref:Uncharacterized protein n=1 Tax=Diversispora epigaea TaxID=1348612 RepID=A0A397JKY7_9GLOM|nr:hypothetical protein Glove_27g70 [Diversispora epigaea]
MKHAIPISILNISDPLLLIPINESSNIDNPEIEEEVLKYIGKAGYHDVLNLQKADYHFTIILYPGNENYETLQKVMKPMISELNDLTTNGLKDSTGKIWTTILYFSSHIKPPLLPMIPLNYYIPDELHVMLRIWDRLWSLVIQELKTQN